MPTEDLGGLTNTKTHWIGSLFWQSLVCHLALYALQYCSSFQHSYVIGRRKFSKTTANQGGLFLRLVVLQLVNPSLKKKTCLPSQ